MSTVDPSATAQPEFAFNAVHNISGRVTIYEPAAQQVVPVSGIVVLLRELARECVADKTESISFGICPSDPTPGWLFIRQENQNGRLRSRMDRLFQETLISTWPRINVDCHIQWEEYS